MTRDELAQEIRRRTPTHGDELIDNLDSCLQAERERIAQAIEALPIYNGGEYDITPSYSLGYQLARKHGARIARAES